MAAAVRTDPYDVTGYNVCPDGANFVWTGWRAQRAGRAETVPAAAMASAAGTVVSGGLVPSAADVGGDPWTRNDRRQDRPVIDPPFATALQAGSGSAAAQPARNRPAPRSEPCPQPQRSRIEDHAAEGRFTI
jgi:hypothetical protein